MTFRAKPVVKRDHRPSWESQDRRNFYLNLGFGLVVLAAVVILLIAGGLTWYDNHLASVGSVDGKSITKDDFADRRAIESWRIEQAERAVRDLTVAGHITAAQAASQQQIIDQQRSQLDPLTLERLVDTRLQAELATTEGITVTPSDIDAQLTKEATTQETRHAWVIEVKPETDAGAIDPTAEQIAAAKAKADAAARDLGSGKAWDDVAKTVSTDASTAPQAGDLGWISKNDNQTDPALLDALFAAGVDAPTTVIVGEDGVFRIGRISEISPEHVDPAYTQTLQNDGIDLAKYRTVVAADVTHQKLEDKIVADATQPGPQRQVSEIFIKKADPEPPAGAFKVRHILYSPKNDPSGAADLADDDPAWAAAQAEAQATYDKLKANPDLFDSVARTESDETVSLGTAGTGGKLNQYIDASQAGQIDQGFLDAVTKPGLVPGQLLAPVKSSFGWHVIQIMYGPTDSAHMTQLKGQADGGADFAKLARDNSEASSAGSGGDLGWIAKGQLDPALTTAIFATPINSTSSVVTLDTGDTTTDGLYLFKVLAEETRTPEGRQLDQIKSTAFSDWYVAKKAAAKIERNETISSGG